jgi:hypothetical protein
MSPSTRTRTLAGHEMEVGSVLLDHLLERCPEVDWHCFLSLSGRGFFDDFFRGS